MSAPNMNQIKPIAPKPNNNSTKSEAVSTTTSGRQTPACRRKQMAFQHPTFGYAIPAPLPAKVARRNARERNRVKQVNCGFEMLRTHIPSAAKQKKMSKVDTLRHAVDYIQKLRRILREQHLEEEDDGDSATPTESPLPPTSSAKAKAKKGQGSSSTLPPLMLPKPSSTSYSLPMTSSYNSAVSPAPSTTYSAPMTPRTPVTPTQSSMDFLANNPHLGHSFSQQQQQHYMSANESGYESPSSASFYCQQQQVLPSPGSSSVRSSLEAAAMNNHMNYHQDMLYSPKGHQQQQQQQMHYSQPHHILPHQQEYQYYESAAAAGAGTNSEEDELLDVIAKWQDD